MLAKPEKVGAGRRACRLGNALFVKRIAPLPVASFCLLAVCGALCQSGRPLGGGHQESFAGTNLQRQPSELPDAPSQIVRTEALKFHSFGDQTRLPLPVGEIGMNANMGKAHAGIVFPETASAISVYKAVPDKGAGAFFSKFLDASHKRNLRYQPSSSDTVMERARDAASRIFVTRDASGKRTLNTRYFVRVLTSVAADSASRRNRARSGTAPLSDFGSTVGNDAGMNLLHEFGPGIRQKVTGRVPEFVSRIGQRISRPQNSR